ncbi:RNA polymerase sigma factor [Chitinophaga sp. NPDC101104]|uniref:RNA polymerase sigma factor n=1 Tax=Chitinophaga sp. NPDC101104 TaxID=3390561 RepID=UPI003D0247BD
MDELKQHIISGFQKGNERAYASIIRDLRPVLIRQAFEIVQSEQEAEEIVSDAFVQIWHKREGFNNGGAIYTYLRRSVHNSCFKKLEKRGEEIKLKATLQEMLTEERIRIDLQTELVDAQLIADVMEFIETLPIRKKKIIKLLLSNKSEQEVAEELGITIRSVYNRKYEVVESLKMHFKKEPTVIALLIYCISKSNIIN